MVSVAFGTSLEKFNISRFLRKDRIEHALGAFKMVLMIVILFLTVILVSQTVSTLMDTENVISDFQSKVITSVEPPIAPIDPQAARAKNYSLISSSNIFGPLGAPATATTVRTPPPQVNLTKFNLIGTFLTEGEAPYAIIEDSKKSLQDVFVVKDMVFGEAKVTGIFYDRVELERNGQKEVLTLDDAPDATASFKNGVADVGGDEYMVEEVELDKALENLPLLLTQARAVPYFKDGRSIGLRLFAIKTGSIFEKIGLKNGDILKSINGNSLADISQAIKLFERLKQERSISVSLERNQEERDFKYQIR